MFKKLSQILLIILFLLFTVTFTRSTAYAAEEFATSYDVIYDVGEDGVTTVTEKVTLKNLTSEYYASQFKLTIGATDISDVKGTDGGGSLEVQQEKKGTSTTLNVKFNQQIAGLGKELPWTLQFKSRDFAEKVGKVWEVRAPKINPSENLENYNLTLSVPVSFGEPTLISPTPKSQTISSGKIFFTFDKAQLEKSGISANFGTNQLFDFDLTYHLENNNLVSILTNITLPPDTSYQDVIYQRITPAPINVTQDDDGNYLAWYKLSRSQKLDVKVIGSAKLYTNSKVKNPTLEDTLRQKYLQADRFWEKDNPQIQGKLTEILGEKVSTAPLSQGDKVKLIYRFVVDSLNYDSSRIEENIERLGAVTALSNPNSAVCMEFTDLFITLLRAANIPARELDGYAYTQNPSLRPSSLSKDILHAWPEYWDEDRGWVMVDPTWENTTGGVDYFNKLDLNHFVFAIKGLSSEYPVPAGSYKYIGQDSHDVKVSLSDDDFLGKPQINVDIEISDPILSGFPSKLKVKITNLGNAVFPSTGFGVTAQNLTILESQKPSLGPVPAFGSSTFEFNIRTKSPFENFSDQITVLVGNQKFTKDVKVVPFFLFQTAPVIAVGIILLMALLYGVILGVFFYRKKFLKAKNDS